MIFSITYYSELHNALFLTNFFFQVKMLLFYNVQITNLTFVGKNMRYTIHSYSIV